MFYYLDEYGMIAIVLAYACSSLFTALFTYVISQKLFFIPYKLPAQFSLIIGTIIISIYPYVLNSFNYLFLPIIFLLIVLILSLWALGSKELKLINNEILNRIKYG